MLLISGHADKPEVLMDERVSGGLVDFLQKPFSSTTLAGRVRRILDASSASKADQSVA